MCKEEGFCVGVSPVPIFCPLFLRAKVTSLVLLLQNLFFLGLLTIVESIAKRFCEHDDEEIVSMFQISYKF